MPSVRALGGDITSRLRRSPELPFATAVRHRKGIDPDKKSIAIAVTLQPRGKTLTDQKIDAVAAKIVAEVTKKTGGTLRG